MEDTMDTGYIGMHIVMRLSGNEKLMHVYERDATYAAFNMSASNPGFFPIELIGDRFIENPWDSPERHTKIEIY